MLIAFVGADGAGKTTQAKVLVARLGAMGLRATYVQPIFQIFNPWHTHETHALARAMSPRLLRRKSRGHRGNQGTARHRLAGRLLSIVGLAYAVTSYGMLRLSLRKSQFVVCDRYFYQYFYDLYGPAARRVASAFPRPNVAIWLDGGIETIRSRVSDSDADVTYLEAVMKMYKEISGDLGFVRVDASPDAKVVEEEVWRHVRKVVPGCPA